jgi:ABC-type multidrug transport system ATPase subunit
MTTHTRLHALDAARASALLLGIVLHATMSFFLPFPAVDSSPSVALGGTFYVIHIFRMSLFFVIAGFFARMSLERHAPRAFMKDRAKRILLPLIAGWVLLAPPIIAIMIWGMQRSFPDADLAAAAPAGQAPEGLPLTHLWFLYYLLLFYIVALAARPWLAAMARPADALLGVLLRSGVAPVALALPLAAVLYLDPGWQVWFGIPTPDFGLTPKLPALAAFGVAFAFGWMLQRQQALLGVIGRRWALHLIAAAALTALCLTLVGLSPRLDAPTELAGGASVRALYVAAYTLAVWCWTFGLLGAALRFCQQPSQAVRYVADASYWMYLVHLPLVFGLQVLAMHWSLHWSVKFPLIVVSSVFLLLVSYHYLVRSTALGALLNGRRVPGGKAEATALAASEGEGDGLSPATLASLDRVRKRYGDTLALDDLSLRVLPGELLAVLGPNGAGKSSAIGLLLGTLEPDAGTVSLMGGSPLDVRNRLGIGVMMQDVELTPLLSVREQIALAASYYPQPLGVGDTIALTGLEEIADRPYGKLSGGQKRMVQFALAICGRPRLLFLDEPTVGLDQQARERVWHTIRSLVKGGCAVLLTTHYLEEAETLADRVAVLMGGKCISEGSVEAMRALVSSKRVSCISSIDTQTARDWPGVIAVMREARHLHITASDAENVVQQLFRADPDLRQLEVRQASLADAFKQLTLKEAA